MNNNSRNLLLLFVQHSLHSAVELIQVLVVVDFHPFSLIPDIGPNSYCTVYCGRRSCLPARQRSLPWALSHLRPSSSYPSVNVCRIGVPMLLLGFAPRLRQ